MKHKRLISLLLAMIMLLAVPIGVFAEDGTGSEAPAADTTFKVTVNGGTTENNPAAENDTVTIKANAAEPGKKFDKCTTQSDEVVFANENDEETTFKMPAHEVTVTATYKDKDYSIGMTKGTATPTKADEGDQVTIVANTPEAGEEFVKWEATGITIDNLTESTLTFIMPANNVTFTATYEKITYNVNVEGETANPNKGKMGEEITLKATVPEDKDFVKWNVTSDNVELRDSNKEETTFTMPAGDVNITAVFKNKSEPAQKYDITVNSDGNGTAKANPATAAKDETVTLTAEPNSGYKFKEWKVITPTSLSIKNDKFTMPGEEVEVKAIFEKKSTPSTKERLYIRDEYVSGNYVYGYVEDEDDYRVKNATVTAYDRYDDKEIDNDKTDSNGKFKIWIGDRYYRDYDYYYDGYYFDRSDVKYDSNDDPYISTSNGRKWLPSDWSSKYYRSGRRYYDYDIYLIAEKTGYHDSSKYYLDDKYYDDYWHDGKYYNGKYSLTPSIESAYAGEKNVKGSAGDYADITVYDDDGYKLGTATADRDGDFTVYLDRALKYGEKIKVEAKDGSRYSSSTTYTVKYKDSTDVTSFVRPAYIKGYPDGTFKPGATITRAEAVKMFVGLINNGKDVAHSSNTGFSDADNMWYSSVIKYAVDKGYIKGYGDGTFKPNEEITRAEFAAMISKFVDKGYPGSTNFKDIKGHWASDAISALYGNKNIKGYPDGTFKPNSKLTRAEAVTILNSVFGRDTRVNSLYNINTSGLKTFSDVSSGYWAYYEILDASNTHSTSKVGTDGFEVWK
ncbi:InlB B-repeat-containing protein [Peptoniphilus sp.]|jgi:hypothetical protein|uniref:InlB B-repeat-containing protein n=1 Tax=Peptoniphilus sp. TaxID=1971214 RepID=UPI003D91F3C3